MLTIRSQAMQTPFGRWTMYECCPPALSHIIESVWEVRGTIEHVASRHYPSGAIDLLVNLGPPQLVIGDDSSRCFGSDEICLSGLQQRPVVVRSERDVHLFSIRFKAAAAAAVFRLPAGITAGQVVWLGDLDRAIARQLLDRLSRARSFAARAAAACAWMEAQCGTLDPHPDYVSWMAAGIARAAGNIRIDSMRQSAAVSRTKLARDFSARLGMTPKLLARVHRFRQARLVIQEPARTLSATAAVCGYFDQAHMTRDFNDLGGVTPGHYLATCYPDGNSGFVAESETFVQSNREMGL